MVSLSNDDLSMLEILDLRCRTYSSEQVSDRIGDENSIDGIGVIEEVYLIDEGKILNLVDGTMCEVCLKMSHQTKAAGAVAAAAGGVGRSVADAAAKARRVSISSVASTTPVKTSSPSAERSDIARTPDEAPTECQEVNLLDAVTLPNVEMSVNDLRLSVNDLQEKIMLLTEDIYKKECRTDPGMATEICCNDAELYVNMNLMEKRLHDEATTLAGRLLASLDGQEDERRRQDIQEILLGGDGYEAKLDQHYNQEKISEGFDVHTKLARKLATVPLHFVVDDSNQSYEMALEPVTAATEATLGQDSESGRWI